MAEQGFSLTSPDFEMHGQIPAGLTCDGENKAPELKWMHPPEGTRSFALIMDDPDAPKGTFTHWVLFDVPAEAQQLSAGAIKGLHGRNDFQQDGYGGPCPPANHGEHRYFFKLFALDVESLQLKDGAPRDEVEKAMEGHVLSQTELIGRYERTTG